MTNFLSYKCHIAVLDADDSEIESWITVRGNHIPIMKGQSKEEAVKSFIEKKGGEYKKESYGKHYVKTGAKGDEKYVDPRTDTLHREKSKVGFFGSEKEAKEYAHKLNHTDPYAGTPFAVKNYERKQFPYEVESEEKVESVKSFIKNKGGEYKEYEPKTYKNKTESKPKQPKDIMEWSFNDVMQLPVSDPRVHKYIAKNNGLSINTVSTMAEGFGSTEDLYFEIDRISDRKGYGWDKIKSKATDSWHRLWGKK